MRDVKLLAQSIADSSLISELNETLAWLCDFGYAALPLPVRKASGFPLSEQLFCG
jgi:hypothetical protein